MDAGHIHAGGQEGSAGGRVGEGIVPGPVKGGERIVSVDSLRGFAVLGILVMNITSYGLPHQAYQNPTVAGGFSGIDRLVWWISFLFFNFKMMPVFTMLFGAGLALMYERFSSARVSFGRFWYRRVLILMLIGAIHGYLLWIGDILFLYSVCGLFLYLFRRKSPRKLLISAAVFYAIGFLPLLGTGYYFGMVRDRMMPEIARKIEAGEDLTEKERANIEQFEEMTKHFEPTPEQIEENIEIYRDGYGRMVADRAPLYLMSTTVMIVFRAFWPTMGLMLAGMAMMKLGVFAASLSNRSYVLMSMCGYGLGVPLAWLSAQGMITNDFAFVEMFKYYSPLNQLGGPLVSLGHTGLVMLACRTGALEGFRRRFSAAGRMAFSNYLGQTLICTTIFYGYGLGLFAEIGRSGMMAIVLCVWILQLVVSPLWLTRFRFGPAEWLWRSLTYGKMQQMRR